MTVNELKFLIRAVQYRMYCTEVRRSLFKATVIVQDRLTSYLKLIINDSNK